MHLLTNKIIFPSVDLADEEGLLAIGGDLTPARLLEAYKNGIFPWYNEDDPICWWSPNPRCVLFPDQLYISKSMQRVLKAGEMVFTVNTAFEEVIRNCKSISRKGEYGTWIHDEMVDAYIQLHKLGYAISGEAWKDGKLAGGLYGVRIGNVFFGESMFSAVKNASKYAFINFVQHLSKDDVKLIDCQMQTNHLLSLGATMIPRSAFTSLLKSYV